MYKNIDLQELQSTQTLIIHMKISMLNDTIFPLVVFHRYVLAVVAMANERFVPNFVFNK